MAEEKKEKSPARAVLSGEKPAVKKEKPAKKSEKKSEKKAAKPKHRHTHIEHLDDGSHVIRRTPQDGGEEVTSSAPDDAGLISNMQSNLGGGEGEEAQPAPAPEPTPAPGV